MCRFVHNTVKSGVIRCANTRRFVGFFGWHATCIIIGIMATSTSKSGEHPAADQRSVRILAKSIYRELRNSGHIRSDIVAFTNAVLELVTTELRDSQEAAE